MSAFAQGPQPRLANTLPANPRAVLVHSRTPHVRNAQDLGPVAPEMPLSGITLVFRRSPIQEAALQELLVELQTPGSPAYHHWLTPESFAARFGIADADIATTENWLATYGFHVDNVARSRDRITFSGTADQAQRAFGAQLHHYRVDGAVHLAPASDLTLPAQLGAMTAAVLHLSDFRPKPAWKAASSTTPAYTDATNGAHYLLPSDMAMMYDFTPANSGITPNAVVGSAQVAVVGQSYVNTGDPSALASFFSWTFANTDPVLPILVPESGVEAVSLGDQGESEIDLEYIKTGGAVGSPLLVFVGDNLNYSVFDALAFAITDNLASVLSISYGECEPLLSSTDLDQLNALFEQAAAQGQTVVASSGDSGSTACAPYSAATGITPTEQQSVAVNFPASSPYVTAVGGTQMAAGTFTVGNTQYWATNGFTTYSPETLLSYVPELAWNEGSAAIGIVAGGGGASSYFARPAWQTTFPGMPDGTYRLVPDIALQASVAAPGFGLCTSDPSLLTPEGQTASCEEGLLGSNLKLTTAGGTSFAAPIFAGMVALLNATEKTNGQGNLNPQLYKLAAIPATYAAAFHDITSGTIACISGAAECTLVSQGDYPAQTGYDEATGLGSIDFNALLAAWPSGSTASLLSTNALIIPSDSAATAGETVSLQINVSTLYAGPIQPVPTGTVSVSIDGVAVNSSLALATSDASISQASAAYSLVVPSTPGYHVATVTYPGDALHAPSSTTYPFLVGSAVASGSFSLAAENLTLASNGSGSTMVTVTPAGGYDGKLIWALVITRGPAPALTGCYGIEPLVVNNVSTAKLLLGVGTACQSASPAYQGQFGAGNRRAQVSGDSQTPQRGLPAEAAYAVLLLCGCLARGRRTWGSMLLLIVLTLGAAGAGLMGCGGGGSSAATSTTPPVSPTPSAPTYTMMLTGTDSVNGAITSSTSFTLTVD